MSKYGMEIQHLFRPSTDVNRGASPVLVLLHGMGGNKTDLMWLGSRLESQFCVLSVRAPISMLEGGHSWYAVRFAPDPIIDSDQAEASRLLMIEFLNDAVKRYKLEPSGVFLAGFSQGAIMAASVALTRPDLVAGLVMMSGRILWQVKTQVASRADLERLKVFVAHGQDDQRLPLFHAHETRDWLVELGVNLTYQEYAGAHEIVADEYRDVAQWLLERIDRI
jgi:phospholipase/carboxylesterase